MLVEEVTRE